MLITAERAGVLTLITGYLWPSSSPRPHTRISPPIASTVWFDRQPRATTADPALSGAFRHREVVRSSGPHGRWLH